MMNAMQGTETLVNGFHQGLTAAIDGWRADRELEKAREAQSAAAWETFAMALLEKNRLLEFHLHVLKGKFDELADCLRQERAGYQDYVVELLAKIQRLTTNLERQSANTHAYGKMRDRLIEQLAEISNPEKTPLLKPEEMLAQLQKDWRDFMDTNIIPNREPLPIRAVGPRAP